MIEVEEHAGPSAGIALIEQHGPPPQEFPVAFERQVERRVEQRMSRINERRQRLVMRGDQSFVNVTRSYRLASGSPIPISRSRSRTGAGRFVIS